MRFFCNRELEPHGQSVTKSEDVRHLKNTHAGSKDSRSHLLVLLPKCPLSAANYLRVIAMGSGAIPSMARASSCLSSRGCTRVKETPHTRRMFHAPPGAQGMGSSLTWSILPILPGYMLIWHRLLVHRSLLAWK